VPTSGRRLCAVPLRQNHHPLYRSVRSGGRGRPPCVRLLRLPYCAEVVRGAGRSWDVMRGQENLKCFLLREGMQCNRMVATCCHTCMIVDHPFYEEKFCAVLDGESDDPHRFKIMKVRSTSVANNASES
jgi:hypothetical protein